MLFTTTLNDFEKKIHLDIIGNINIYLINEFHIILIIVQKIIIQTYKSYKPSQEKKYFALIIYSSTQLKQILKRYEL